MLSYFRSLGPRRFAVLIGFLSLSLIRGFLYSVLIPPWQAPDEPRNVEYAIRLAEERWFLGQENLSPELQREILSSMKELDFWKLIGREEPETVPESFSDDPFLIRSGTQFGDKSPLYSLVPALVFNLLSTQDIVLRLYILRWFSVVLSGATVLVSCLVAFELFPEDRFMIIAIPAFITFLPMFTFIGASANNDILAVLVASLLIWQLVRALKTGLSRRSVMVICALTILAVLAKKTALFTVPLVVAAIVLLTRGSRVRVPRTYRFAAGILGLISVLLLAVILGWRGDDAAGWDRMLEPGASTRSGSIARSGRYSLRIDRGRLNQSLPFNTVRALRGKIVTLEAWVRSAGTSQKASLLVTDDQGGSLEVFDVTGTWRSRAITHTVSPRAKIVRVILGPGQRPHEGQELYFDDVTLVETGREGGNLLHNGSAEVAGLRARPHLRGLTRYVTARQLLDPRSYDLDSVKRYLLYTLLTFAGFWANFGWLTLPLDPRWYVWLALITLAASVGLTLWFIKMVRDWKSNSNGALSWRVKSLLLFVVAFCLIVVQTALPMVGRQWQPQGRYLFPAIIPIATLLALGIRNILPRASPTPLAAAYVICLFAFDAICVIGYIIPYYHSA